MWWKASVIWLALMVLAILNGGLRVKAIIPFTGEPAGHVISTLLLCLLILAATWATLPWAGPSTTGEAWAIGFLWLGLTLAFEFGMGRFISHLTWHQMLAEYNVLKGRIWVLVPLCTWLAPVWAGHWRGLLH